MPASPFPRELETKRLRLRSFSEADLPAFVGYRSDADVARYQSWLPSYSMEDAEAFWRTQSVQAFDQPGSWFQVAIADREHDELIGDIALHFIEPKGEQVEIGFTLSPVHQGQGKASEAIRAMLAYLFETMGKHRVHAVIDTQNRSAEQLLTALAFRREAHHVEHVYFKGAWGDEFVFAMLAREWQSQPQDASCSPRP